jgi:hypothetical protein
LPHAKRKGEKNTAALSKFIMTRLKMEGTGFFFLVSKLATSPVCSLKLCLYFKCSVFYRREKVENTKRTGDERRTRNRIKREREREREREKKWNKGGYFLPQLLRV